MSSQVPTANLETDDNRIADRLRALELRLNALGESKTRLPDAGLFRQLLFERELRERLLFAKAFGDANRFVLDLNLAVDNRIAPWIVRIMERGRTALQPYADTAMRQLDLAEAERRLQAQESRLPEVMSRFAALRKRGACLEQRVALAGQRVDHLWLQQDQEGMGAWRTVMRAIASRAELESAPRSFVREPSRKEHTTVASTIRCGRCNELAVRRIKRETLLEELLRIVFVAPYRCSHCGERSYRFR